ncbi:MAG: D-tyrosyl-tRNA(Tyr) deacylase [Fimbriimonadaceae bacterium]|nr:D-tyrosyl-tRNA(Tyr) deacylase [Chitinophagales bacterium]
MRAVIQRVKNCSVEIDEKIYSSIRHGLLILLGVEETDDAEDINWLAQKIINLRIFADENDLMNLSVIDTNGELLIVSQFTLFASTKKGNRPSFIRSAKQDVAIPLYEQFVKALSQLSGKEIKTGIFGADMKVSLINDGPVTIIIDTKIKE